MREVLTVKEPSEYKIGFKGKIMDICSPVKFYCFLTSFIPRFFILLVSHATD